MPCQVEFGTNRLSVFFREIFGVSWKRAKLSTSPKMISVCEEEEKILRKYIVKYTRQFCYSSSEENSHNLHFLHQAIYLHLHESHSNFSCFNNCFAAAAAASAASTSLLQLRVWWPLTNERVTQSWLSIICCFYAKVDRISSISTCIL